jgi:surface protein
MGTTIDKLNKVQETKEAIKQAIINKGVKIPDGTIFADYPNKISEITSGEGGGEELVGDYVILRFNSNLNSASDFLKKSSEVELNFDISNVTNMENMFSDFENSRTIKGFDQWDTSNVTNMSWMFNNCRSLESLDLSSFNTSNVERMWGMFSNCENLKELNLSNFEVREDCDTNRMFRECNRLHTLRLDNCSNDTIRKIIESDDFPIGGAEDYEGTRQIFVKEENVGDLTAPNGWIFVDSDGNEIVQEIPLYQPDMFRDNRDIKGVSVIVTSEHDNLSEMFSECENLRTIKDFDQWDTSNVTTMKKMFYSCRNLKLLDLSSFDTSNVENMREMFNRCENLKELNLSSFEIRENCDTDRMFVDCRRLHTLRLDNCNEGTIRKIVESDEFPTGEVWDYEGTRQIFVKAENVVSLVAPGGWEFVDAVTGEVIVQEEPEFYIPGYYKGRDIEEATTMVTSKHDDLSGMFQDCENLRTINNISEWDTSNITNMDNMFQRCNSLVSLDLSKWNVSKVESMRDMIQGCNSLVSVNASNWDVSNVANMWGMFADCRSLEDLDLSNWDMTNVSDTTYMFNNSSNLRTLRLDNCNEETVRKIITVGSFPTGDIGVLRQIFVKVDVSDLTEPDGWVFSPLAEGDEE